MKNKLFLRNEGGKRFAAIDIDAITYFSCIKDADFVRAEMWLPSLVLLFYSPYPEILKRLT